jgi:F0F1-type ATP synthase gamma subunit
VRGRIRATKNVAKLTGVMKLVASSKLKGAEKNLQDARPFGVRACAASSRARRERGGRARLAHAAARAQRRGAAVRTRALRIGRHRVSRR